MPADLEQRVELRVCVTSHPPVRAVRREAPSPCATPVPAASTRYFDLFDLDGGGTIDRDELGALVRGALERPLSDQQLDDLMHRLDEDGSGAVEFAEFSQWWTAEVVAKQKKRGGFMRGVMKAKRFMQRTLGQSGMQLAAKQVVISRMQKEGRDRARAEFRRQYAPPHACSTCQRAFALYGDMVRHKCSTVLQQQQEERIRRQASRRQVGTGAGAGAGAGARGGVRRTKSGRGLTLEEPKPPEPVYGVIKGQDLQRHVNAAPETCVVSSLAPAVLTLDAVVRVLTRVVLFPLHSTPPYPPQVRESTRAAGGHC